MVYPTHGAGSLCSTGISSTSWSTIGYERRHDPLLGPMEVDAFARALLSGQPTVPRYFARMRPMNQAGPPLLGGIVPEVAPLSGDGLESALGGGPIVDARSPRTMRGSTSLARCRSRPARRSGRGSGGSSIRTGRSSPGRACRSRRPGRQALRSGSSHSWLCRRRLRGVVPCRAPGRGRDRPHGQRPRRIARSAGSGSAVRRRCPPAVRVRGRPRSGSTHIGAGELPEKLDELPHDRPIATICASGYRSSVAASMLRAAGFEDVAPVANGLPTWEAHGFPVEYGPEAGSVDWPAATAAAGETHAH